MREFARVLSSIGVDVPKSARILDFGCGAGETVHALRDQGYDAVGYDVDSAISLHDKSDSAPFIHIGSPLNLRLPFDDDTVDLVLSDQVFEHVPDQATVWRQLYRITRPGGQALHVIPVRYMPIDGHLFVPFGSVITYR